MFLKGAECAFRDTHFARLLESFLLRSATLYLLLVFGCHLEHRHGLYSPPVFLKGYLPKSSLAVDPDRLYIEQITCPVVSVSTSTNEQY